VWGRRNTVSRGRQGAVERPWTCAGTCGAPLARVRLLVLAVLAGCAHAPPESCTLPLAPGGDAAASRPVERVGTIASIAIEGAPAIAPLLRGVIETHTGEALAEAPLAADLRRLWALGVLADVRVDARATAAGIAVVFAVTPEPPIAAVHGADAPELRRLRYLAGAPFEPRRIARIAGEIEAAYVRDGHVDARVEVRRRRSHEVELCVDAKPGPQVTIRSLTFPGSHAVPEVTLLGVLHGKGVNHPGGTYDAGALERDNLWLLAEYFDRGMLEARVDPPRVTRRGDRLDIAIPVSEGPVFRIGALRGFVLPRGVASGEVFARSKLVAGLNALDEQLDATVTPITKLDTDARRVDMTFTVEWRMPWSVLHWLASR